MRETVSIIVPSAFDIGRRDAIERALYSARSQRGVQVIPIIVANGPRADHDLVDRWKNNRSVRFFYLEEGSYPKARYFGRVQVDTPFFSFLDDDDELLPGAIRRRLKPFVHDHDIDVVVSNGLTITGGCEKRRLKKIEQHKKDPLGGLMEENWLDNCGALFRTSSITPYYFDPNLKYLEWTITAFLLAYEKKRIEFLDIPTYRYNDTPGSLSKTLQYDIGTLTGIEYMLRFDVQCSIRQALLRKYAAGMNRVSRRYLKDLNMTEAWRYHLKTLCVPGGYRYFLFTRKLLDPWWRRLFYRDNLPK